MIISVESEGLPKPDPLSMRNIEMADQIQTNDGMMLGSGQRAWHGKGTVIDGLATAEEALKHANLNWQVKKAPLTYVIGDDVYEVEDRCVTYRDDDNTRLGIVGADYEIFQNQEVFSMFDSVVDSKAAIYETAGSLYGGRKVFVTASLPAMTKIGVKGDDLIENYILISTSHDGTASTVAKRIKTRVVCNNTLTAALREDGRDFKIRHSQNMKDRVEQAMEAIGLAKKRIDDDAELYNAMAKKEVNDAEVKAFLEKCFKMAVVPTKKEADTLLDGKKKEPKENYLLVAAKETYAASETVQRGTLWGAFNAVTEVVNHKRRGQNRIGGNDKDENLLDALLFGKASELMLNAEKEAVAILRR